MIRLLTIIPILSLLVISCQKDPVADAIITPNPAYVGDSITFANLSLNADTYEWDLGDGTTSSDADVVHSYIDPGQYLVSLSVFGNRSGVSTASFEVDVIGTDLKVRVLEYFDLYPVRDARVRVYPTLDDWEAKTNLIDELFTNGIGECVFTELSHVRYYIEVVEASHNNFTLKTEDIRNIETMPLTSPVHLFVAYVDVIDTPAKKSTVQTRPLKINNFTTPKKKN